MQILRGRNVREVPFASISRHITFGRKDDVYSYRHIYIEYIRPYSPRSKMEQVRPKESLQYLFDYWRLSEKVKKLLSFREYFKLHISSLLKYPYNRANK